MGIDGIPRCHMAPTDAMARPARRAEDEENRTMSVAGKTGKNPFPFARLLEGLGKRPGDALRLWETWAATQFDQLARNGKFLGPMG